MDYTRAFDTVGYEIIFELVGKDMKHKIKKEKERYYDFTGEY